MSIAIFLHIFSPHTLDSLLERIGTFPFGFNLYVNLVEGHSDHLRQAILDKHPSAAINVSPNQGMDPGGQLRTLHYWLTNGKDEEFLIFIHSKRVDEYRDLFSRIILPDKAKLAMQKFEDPQIGMLGVKEWYLNANLNQEQCAQYGCEYDQSQRYGAPIQNCEFYCDWLKLNNFKTNSFAFIGGTMFWVRSKIYRDVFKDFPILDLVKELPPFENGGKTHALERIFGYIVLSAGYRIEGI